MATLDLLAATAAVCSIDPVLAAFIRTHGPFEPRPGQGDPFRALARAIVFQQLAGKAAEAIHGRLVRAVGEVTPEAVVAADPEALRAAGLSAAKAASLVDLATKVLDGTVPLEGIDALDDEAIVQRLTTVRGIGRWTAEMFLLFELQRPDVWPVDDLGVRNGFGLIFGLRGPISPRDLQAAGERFRPYRSLLALHCWHAVHVARGEVPGVPPAGHERSAAAR